MNQLQLLQQGAAHLRACRMEEAEHSFHEVLRGDSGHGPANSMMGLLRFQQDRAADALLFFTAALRRQSDAATLTNYGLTLDRLGRQEEALAAFDRVLARLVFAPNPPLDRHLARHRLAGLFLDTSYYNAHTTGGDAPWAGLPLITCPGRSFASRVAASLLMAAGLPELITASLQDYEALALALARDPARLESHRRRLVENRDRCALFDFDRHRRGIEAAYVRMWEIAQADGTPESFSVAELRP